MAEGDQPAASFRDWLSESPPPPPLTRFTRHTISGNIFDITSKYHPPASVVRSGTRGCVCSFLDSETNEKVAIKKINKAFCCAIHSKQTLREVKLMRHFNHENIISLKDVIPPLIREFFDDVYIVYELMPTDLDQVLKSDQELSEPHCKYILYQLLRGLKYIHSANVVHLDLKPSNILLNEDCEVKICDFGFARAASEAVVTTETVVTTWYRAPEVLSESYRYSKAIDMWSVGCIFMEMLVGRPLFKGTDPLIHLPGKSVYDLLPRENRSAIDLVAKMLFFDHRERITVEDALAHPYLLKLHDVDDEPTCQTVFGFDFSRQLLTLDEMKEMKEMVYQDCLAFNPRN